MGELAMKNLRKSRLQVATATTMVTAEVMRARAHTAGSYMFMAFLRFTFILQSISASSAMINNLCIYIYIAVSSYNYCTIVSPRKPFENISLYLYVDCTCVCE